MAESLGKIVLLVGRGDHTGTHRVSCKHFADEFRNFGYETEFVFVDGKASLEQLARLLSTGSVSCVHVEQGQLLDIRVADGKNLFDFFKTPVCSQIRDHWFYPWLYSNLTNKPLRSLCVHTHRSHSQISGYWPGRDIYGLHTAQYAGSSRIFEPSLGGKPIFVGTVNDSRLHLENLLAKHSGSAFFQSIAERLYEEATETLRIPQWFWDIEYTSPSIAIAGLSGTFSVGEYYDLFTVARWAVRECFIGILCEFDVDLYVKGNWAPLNTNVKANLNTGGISKFDAQKILDRSSLILSDQAGFDEALGERVATAFLLNKPILMRQPDATFSWLLDSSGGSVSTYGSASDLRESLSVAVAREFEPLMSGLVPRDILPLSYVTEVVRWLSQAGH